MNSLRLDKDQIRQSLTKDDVAKILLDLGSEEYKLDRKGNLIFTTVCHGGDSYKLYYYENTQTFTCYTNCGSGKDIYQIVMDAKASQGYEFTFPDAVKYVAEITGKKFSAKRVEKRSSKIDDWDWLNKFKRKPKMTEELPAYDENVLDVFLPYGNDWIDEGITERVANKFEIKYYLKKHQIILVNRDENGRLIGIRSRNTDKDLLEQGLKYVPTIVGNTEYRFPSAFYLYGLYHNKNNISRIKKCLIFEGEKSVLKAEEMYGENNFTVAVLGSNISSWQRDKILSLGVNEVFIAFDKFREKQNDESDEVYEKKLLEYEKRLVRLAHLFTPYVRTYIIYDQEDLLDPTDAPIDKSQEVFEELMKRKIEINTKDVIL